MEDSSESSEQGSAFGEKASREEDSRDISNTHGETETTKDSSNERALTIGEG